MLNKNPTQLALFGARLGYSQESIAGYLVKRRGVTQRQARQIANEAVLVAKAEAEADRLALANYDA